MRSITQSFLKVGFVIVATTAILFAQQSGFWDRFFSKKEPQVLQSGPTARLEPHPTAVTLQESFAKVAEAIKPAVVNISAVQIARVQEDPQQFFYGDPNEFFYRFFGETPSFPRQPRQREYRTEGTGSGVIIDAEGYILTNNHVVQGADQLTVTLSDGKTHRGKVVGTDPRTDLAVIQIKASNPFAFAPLGDSSSMRVGDWVLAVGSPFGLQQTVTAGIVSAIRQSLNIEGRSFRNLLQTDAAINRGNSGGPLVNIKGEVIGINTAIYAPTGVFSGIGFAIPVNDAKAILRDLIQKGFVERSWMGVEIAEVDEVIAQQFGLKTTEGALINQVLPGSPAEKAGLERGDVILEFDGKKVTNIQNLQDMVSATPTNRNVPVKILRDGKTRTIELKTATMPNQAAERPRQDNDEEKKTAEATTLEWLGAKFSDLSPRIKTRYGLDESIKQGVVLIEVPAQSLAAEAGLMEGDLIRAINRIEIKRIQDLKRATATINAKKGVVFDVVRKGRSFYLSFKSLQ